MKKSSMTPLTNPADIPEFSSEEEARAFWDSHEITEEYLEQAGEAIDLPPTRPRRRSHSTSVRLDEDLSRRLKVLAHKKGKGYQTLLKEFVLERLYEEEKREGIIR
jgi:uncharacterized protein (DUF4415 family)